MSYGVGMFSGMPVVANEEAVLVVDKSVVNGEEYVFVQAVWIPLHQYLLLDEGFFCEVGRTRIGRLVGGFPWSWGVLASRCFCGRGGHGLPWAQRS